MESKPRHTHRGILFDRDGILNKIVMRENVVGSPRTLSEFILFEQTSSLLHLAGQKGAVAVVTNQPDVSRGLLDAITLEHMHKKLHQASPGTINLILWEGSSHPDHPRRKPNPGMLQEAATALDLRLKSSWFIGDSPKDMKAGERAGTHTVLLETNYNKHIHGSGEINVKSHDELLEWLKSLP